MGELVTIIKDVVLALTGVVVAAVTIHKEVRESRETRKPREPPVEPE